MQQWGTNGMWVLTTTNGSSGGGGDPSLTPAVWMPGIDIHGINDATPCPRGTPNATDCESKCRAANESQSYPCEGWTHHFNHRGGAAQGWRCCMKTNITGLAMSVQSPPLTSGCLDPAAVNRSIHGGGGGGSQQYGDGVVKPPDGPSNCTTSGRECRWVHVSKFCIHVSFGLSLSLSLSCFISMCACTYVRICMRVCYHTTEREREREREREKAHAHSLTHSFTMACRYEYDDPTNQWRMLRVINATHSFAFME